jgi:hypothetical protein
MKLIVEALSVGVIVVMVGTIVSFVIGKSLKVDLPPVCKDWNKNYVMEVSLFFTGVATHLLCEGLGINKWYCKKGVACLK